MTVSTDPEGQQVIAVVPVKSSGDEWTQFPADAGKSGRIGPGGEKGTVLYFTYHGTGAVDFLEFELK